MSQSSASASAVVVQQRVMAEAPQGPPHKLLGVYPALLQEKPADPIMTFLSGIDGCLHDVPVATEMQRTEGNTEFSFVLSSRTHSETYASVLTRSSRQ